MLELKFGDLGMDCNTAIMGSTIEEVKQKGMDHIKKGHAAQLKSMTTAQLAGLSKLIETKTK